MNCTGCGGSLQSGDHDTCHYGFDEPKPYEEYRAESEGHYKSIMSHYGAPESAHAPIEKTFIPAPTDISFRGNQWRRRNPAGKYK